jgi:hypothetical protein
MGRNSDNTNTHVDRVLSTFNEYSCIQVDVVLFSTSENPDVSVANLVYPAELSHDFAYVPRQWLVENWCCLSHDYIMYTENDLVITESAVLSCIANNNYVSRFSSKYISGFIRYEQKGRKEYIDMLPCVRPTVEKVLKAADGRKFWIPGNLHSGNFLLSHAQMDHMIENRLLQTRHAQYGRQYYGILESAASDVYLEFVKVLPEDFSSIEIEHLPNKYHGLSYTDLAEQIRNPSGNVGC